MKMQMQMMIVLGTLEQMFNILYHSFPQLRNNYIFKLFISQNINLLTTP